MGIKINVAEVLAQAEQRKKEPKPMPKVIIGKSVTSTVIRKPSEPVRKDDLPGTAILEELEKQFHDLKIERAKLSTQTDTIVKEVAAKLRKESPAAEKAFLEGDVPVPRIREHYNKIQVLTDHLKTLYDKIDYVKQHGRLPSEPTLSVSNEDSMDVKAIQYEIRRLDDLICKTKKKVDKANGGIKKPKNSDRMLLWKSVIAKAEDEREMWKQKLTQKRYESREQRPSAE